jgi:hypothetical protein
MSSTISAGRTPKVMIENIGGDLSLVGWEGDDILLKGDSDEIHFKQDGEEVKISCDDDISIRVPRAASVFINKIGGDASIRGIMGALEIKDIEGDLSMRDVNSIAIDTIHSDFSLRGAKGNLFIKSAHNDVSVRDVEGTVTFESIADDLALRDVRGNVTANVAEDVVLYLNPQAGNTYTVNAGEDILLVMPPKANATLTLNADKIDIEWKGVINDDDATARVITIGDGSANVTLSAGGDIRVSNRSDAGESAEDFGNFAGMNFDWSGFGDRISRQVEHATRDVGRKVEEATRRMNIKVEDMARKANRRGPKVAVGVGRWNWDLSPKGVPMTPKAQASEEERLVILKMLQEKKITAEEADKLLAALEGGS